ncbi:MAG TPA: hypothetical protein VNH64_12820 [Parvularculaceae bacterium]|nr:hypothetical protein [Parvularculaceae bacterium]
MNALKTGVTLASAVAIYALASASAAPTPNGATGASVGAGDTVHCYGVNSCKGQADCKTAAHDCKGQNSCKGQGFKAQKASTCLSGGGVISDLAAS